MPKIPYTIYVEYHNRNIVMALDKLSLNGVSVCEVKCKKKFTGWFFILLFIKVIQIHEQK